MKTWIKFIAQKAALILIVILGLISITSDCDPDPDPNPEPCPDILLELLYQPTAAMGWEWSQIGEYHDYDYAILYGSNNERYVGHGYVTNYLFDNLTKPIIGLGFDMYVRDESDFPLNKLSMICVAYLMEYTLPIATCEMSATWGTELSVTLPNGLCITTQPATCNVKEEGEGDANFQLFFIEDPEGKLSVSGSGRPALEKAVMNALEEDVKGENQFWVPYSTSSKQSLIRNFSGAFNVKNGIRAKVFLGVSVIMASYEPGWVCLNRCTTSPDDRYADHGILSINYGGEDGVVCILMSGSR